MADEQQDKATEQESMDILEDVIKTESELESKLQENLQELNTRYLRLAADFENFRKRQAQEREHLFKYGAQNTLESLLPVLDNLARAQQSLSSTSDPAMLYKSFEMLSQQLMDSLKGVGLSVMSPKGELFDPEKHEAVSQVENGDVPDHTIMDVYQDGYLLFDKVLRPAQVVVSVAPQSGQSTQKDADFEPLKNESANPFQQASPGPGNTR